MHQARGARGGRSGGARKKDKEAKEAKKDANKNTNKNVQKDTNKADQKDTNKNEDDTTYPSKRKKGTVIKIQIIHFYGMENVNKKIAKHQNQRLCSPP